MIEIIPAIDISDGKVVRLTRGELDRKTVYGDDPVEAAKRWEDAGAKRLHVVDLDGAVAGAPRNDESVAAIVNGVAVPVQVGGGVRDLAAVRTWIDVGADRVVLGTAALTDDEFLRGALDAAPGRVVVALDARGRELRVAGWMEGSGLDLLETARRLAQLGVPRLLCTDIARDGTMTGPNVELVAEVAAVAGVPVIASGGVSTMEDLRVLRKVDGIDGVIVGRALYEGRIDLREALAI